ERTRDGKPPFFTAGKRERELTRDVLDAELREQFIAASFALFAIEARRLENGQQVLLDGQLAEDRLLLRQIPHAAARALVHGEGGHVFAAEGYAPGIRTHETHYHV